MNNNQSIKMSKFSKYFCK